VIVVIVARRAHLEGGLMEEVEVEVKHGGRVTNGVS